MDDLNMTTTQGRISALFYCLKPHLLAGLPLCADNYLNQVGILPIMQGVCPKESSSHKGYRDFVQQTDPMFSGQLHQAAYSQLAYNSLKTFQSPNSGFAHNGCNSLILFQTAYSQSARNLCISLSPAQIGRSPINALNSSDSLELANSLILAITCTAGSRGKPEKCSGSPEDKHCLGSHKLGDLPSLEAQTIAATCTPGAQKEKDNAANPTLWMNSFLNHEVNQYSPVLDDARKPDLAYGDFRSATLLYEKNQYLAALQDSLPSLRGGVNRLLTDNIGTQNHTETSGEVGCISLVDVVQLSTYKKSVGQPSGDSLVLLSNLNSTSRFKAEVTNWPVLSPGAFTASTASIIPCGTRAATVCDFAFTALVAIFMNPSINKRDYATKKNSVQHLTRSNPCLKLVFNTLSTGKAQEVSKTAKPAGATNTNGLLTTNVNASNEVAMLDHTTHPQGRDSLTLNKFTWRFLALSRTDFKAKPCCLSVEAVTEQDARRILAPHFILSLAARLPLRGVEMTPPSTVEKTATVREVSHA